MKGEGVFLVVAVGIGGAIYLAKRKHEDDMRIPPKHDSLGMISDEARPLFEDFERRLKAANLPFKRYETHRTPARQAYLYAKGRTIPGPGANSKNPLGSTVTNADGEKRKSNHQHARAADYILDFKSSYWGSDGAPKVVREAGPWYAGPETIGLWIAFGGHAKAAGLRWGGDWERFKDLPHVEYRP